MDIETEEHNDESIKQNRNKIRILMMNINGFPSKKANRHKLKALNELINHKDIGIFIETGINQDNKPLQIHDHNTYVRINEQINKENAQY